jgi:hypothetical protein
MQLDVSIQNALQVFIDLYCNSYSDISEDQKSVIQSRYNTELYVEKLIPVLMIYFTEEDIRGLIKFYSSPLGQKILDEQFYSSFKNITDSLSREIEQEILYQHGKSQKRQTD